MVRHHASTHSQDVSSMTKRYHDWYKMQKDVQGWQNIPADTDLAHRLAALDLSINLDHCHYALRDLLRGFRCPPDRGPDFFVITELELGKQCLPELFKFYQECYDRSRYGIYIAVLSYYLTPGTVHPDLTGPYSKNIDTVFRQNFTYADAIENISTVSDYPLVHAQKQNYLAEGANFIFVHPNIRYFLWKGELANGK